MNLSEHFDITAVVEALATGSSDARLLADPNVAVLENEEAVFEKVPGNPLPATHANAAGWHDRYDSLQKSRHQLHVTPKIASEGIIRMDGETQGQPARRIYPGDNQPIIDYELGCDRAHDLRIAKRS